MKTLPKNRLGSINPILDHPFSVELNFTRAYQEHEHAHPALREAHCLATMFPDALSPIEPETDRFAGRFISTPGVDKILYEWDATRHNIPAVGFLPLTPGAIGSGGYYCHEVTLRKKIEDLNPDAETRRELESVIEFWKTRTVEAICREAYPEEMKQALPFDKLEGRQFANPAFPLVRMTGPMFDWDKLVQGGIPGLRTQIDHSGKTMKGDPEFYTGMHLGLDLLAKVCLFYADQANQLAEDPDNWKQAQDLREQSEILTRMTRGAPTSFREACQLVLIFGVVSGAYSWGRMDDYLGNWLCQDLDTGILSEAEAINLLASLWTIINDNGAPYDNRVIIGGKGRLSPQEADRFALLAMQATDQTRLPLPQLSLRFYDGQNPELYEKALEVIGRGCTFPMLYNDDVNIPAVAHAMEISLEEAEQYVPYGCGEYVLYKTSFGTPSGIFNHTKVLECLIRNGKEILTGRNVGPQLGHLRDFKTFDDLLEAYFTALTFWIELMADQQKLEYEIVAQQCSYLYWSMLYANCLERGRPMFSGGVRHLAGTLESYGQINVSDSLLGIKKAVYDEKWVTADELVEAMDNNYKGYEWLREKLKQVPKFGNDLDEADDMAKTIHDFTCRTTRAQASRVGLHSYLIVIINNLANTVLGEHTLASADGREEGQPLANAINPSPGMDRSGLTACLNSLVKLPCDIHAGAVQNMKFAPEFFDRHFDKLKAILKVYFQKGSQAMITVVSPGDLEDAIIHPEKYPNLMVRVGGFSARFVELPPGVQQEVLHRTLQQL